MVLSDVSLQAEPAHGREFWKTLRKTTMQFRRDSSIFPPIREPSGYLGSTDANFETILRAYSAWIKERGQLSPAALSSV